MTEEKIFGQQQICPICARIFTICHGCYRGQKFCKASCQQAASRMRQRQAGKRYQQSEGGRRKHRLRQNAYRKRKKSVTHASSQAEPNRVEPDPVKDAPAAISVAQCSICKRIVRFFLNEKIHNPVTYRRRKHDRNRRGGSDPPPFLR